MFEAGRPHLRTEKKRILALMEITTLAHVIVAFALYASGTVYAVWSVFLSRMTAAERRSTYPPFLVIGAVCLVLLGMGLGELREASLNEVLYVLTLIFNVGLFMALSIIYFRARKLLPISSATLYFLQGTLAAIVLISPDIPVAALLLIGAAVIALFIRSTQSMFLQHVRFVAYLVWGAGTFGLILFPYASGICFTETCEPLIDWHTLLGAGFAVVYALWFGFGILIFALWPYFYWKPRSAIRTELKELRESLFSGAEKELGMPGQKITSHIVMALCGLAAGGVLLLATGSGPAPVLALGAILVSTYENYRVQTTQRTSLIQQAAAIRPK